MLIMLGLGLVPAGAAAALAVALVCLAAAAWWTVERAPRRLERALRAQGVGGGRYQLLLGGDVAENGRLNREAWSRPLPLGCHRIAPRVLPLLWNAVRDHVPRVMIPDPELVREVFNKFDQFGKPKMIRVGKLLATGVVSYEGEKWAKHRRILNHAFHHEKIKRMLPVFANCCTEMVTRWENSISLEAASEIDVWPEFRNLTGDVISRTAFGSSYQEGRRIFQLQEELAQYLTEALQKLFIPGYWYLPTKNNRRMREIDREVRKILLEIIGNKERAITNGENSNDNMLGLLVESNTKQPELGMSTDDIIEECKLFYFAGMETTSVLLTWTLIVLSMHPEWQERAREEVLHHFGRTTTPDYDSLSRLKIVTMILYEVLRLYPPVVLLNRRTFKETNLGGIKFPADMNLILPILFIHHDPEIWGKDASEFNPGRFADGISNASKYHDASFFPFGWGPRICIGQSFALLEAKMALSMILQRFSLELSPSYIHAPYIVLTLRPQHGAQIKLKRI
uniref:Cytochrome P450 n=1 Tax=Oryza nivara TaxID=4536 RepID=A0A0E0HDK6_ORYNI